MGYKVKVQLINRPAARSYYVNFPVAVADSIGVEKGEEWEWLLEDKNTLILKRRNTNDSGKNDGKGPPTG